MKTPEDAKRRQDAVLALVVRAAVDGKRCPTNEEIAKYLKESGMLRRAAAGSIPSIMRELVREGLITVRVYGSNWRDVVVVSGPNAGKATMPPPSGGKPYRVIDQAERQRRDTTTGPLYKST